MNYYEMRGMVAKLTDQEGRQSELVLDEVPGGTYRQQTPRQTLIPDIYNNVRV